MSTMLADPDTSKMQHTINLGDLDGTPVVVRREYDGTLDYGARVAEFQRAVTRAREVIAHCAESEGDAVRHFRREFVDLLALSLNLGLYPLGIAETVEAAGEDYGIDAAEVDRLIEALDTCLNTYATKTGLLLDGGAFVFDDFADLAAAKPAPAEEPALAGVLGDHFWTEREAFSHIRDAARARLIAPDAVFAAVLMRVAALTDFRIVLPDIVGRYGSLNSAAVLVAPSGGGKGSSLDTARDLLPTPVVSSVRFKEAPVGSGEGMVRAYFEQTKETGEDRKVRTEWQQRYDALAFRIDEGEMLKSLGERSGQTTMTMIRSAWSGESLGNSYADKDRRGFVLAPHAYRASLVMGVQPEHAAFLLDDAAGGTPQRFLWVAWIDPTAPELDQIPTWPGPLDWTPPDWRDGARVKIGGYERGVMRVAPPIVAEIRQHRHDVTRAVARPNPLDAHADLVQLKTAGLLAVLDGRLDVTEDDWRLAAIVCGTSRRVRGWLQEYMRQTAERAEDGAISRSVRRSLASEAAKVTVHQTIERVADLIARRLGDSGPEGLTRGALRKSITSKDRDVFDAALADACARGIIAENDGRISIVNQSATAAGRRRANE